MQPSFKTFRRWIGLVRFLFLVGLVGSGYLVYGMAGGQPPAVDQLSDDDPRAVRAEIFNHPLKVIAEHDAVFLGTIKEQAIRLIEEDCSRSKENGSRSGEPCFPRKGATQMSYTLTVDQVWKGVGGDEVTLYDKEIAFKGTPPAGLPPFDFFKWKEMIQVGYSYLVFARKRPEDGALMLTGRGWIQREDRSVISRIFLTAAQENISRETLKPQLHRIARYHQSETARAHALEYLLSQWPDQESPDSQLTESLLLAKGGREIYVVAAKAMGDRRFINHPAITNFLVDLATFPDIFVQEEALRALAIIAQGNEDIKQRLQKLFDREQGKTFKNKIRSERHERFVRALRGALEAL